MLVCTGNDFSDEKAAMCIGDGILCNDRLEYLDLSHNELNERGAAYIALALRKLFRKQVYKNNSKDILRIWWPETFSQEALWERTNQHIPSYVLTWNTQRKRKGREMSVAETWKYRWLKHAVNVKNYSSL